MDDFAIGFRSGQSGIGVLSVETRAIPWGAISELALRHGVMQIVRMSFRHPFLAGLALTLAAAMVGGWKMIAEGTAWTATYALFGMALLLIIYLPANLVIQSILHQILHWMPRLHASHRWIIMNLPVAGLLLFHLCSVLAHQEPESVFRRYVLDPIPPSVRIVQYGIKQPVGELHIGLEMAGTASDLEAIILLGKYQKEPLQRASEALHLTRLSSRLKTQTGVEVNLSLPFSYYLGRDSPSFVICNSNQTRAFVYLRQ